MTSRFLRYRQTERPADRQPLLLESWLSHFSRVPRGILRAEHTFHACGAKLEVLLHFSEFIMEVVTSLTMAWPATSASSLRTKATSALGPFQAAPPAPRDSAAREAVFVVLPDGSIRMYDQEGDLTAEAVLGEYPDHRLGLGQGPRFYALAPTRVLSRGATYYLRRYASALADSLAQDTALSVLAPTGTPRLVHPDLVSEGSSEQRGALCLPCPLDR